MLASAANVVPIADRSGRSLAEAAKAYFAVSDRFGFGRIDQMTEEVATGGYYEGLALKKARDSLETAHRDLRASVIANGSGGDVAAWEAERRRARHRDGGAGGENPLRPPPVDGQGSGRREPALSEAGARG